MRKRKGMSAAQGAADKWSGSLLRALNTGNSNRVLGLFTELAKGVK